MTELVQDLRADFITILDGLVVTHQGNSVSLNAAYWSDTQDVILPAVFVRSMHSTPASGSMGGDVDTFDVTYDLSIQAVDSDVSGTLIDGESFVLDAANAIHRRVREYRHDLGDAWNVRLAGDVSLPAENVDGTFIFERVLSFRAYSVEQF